MNSVNKKLGSIEDYSEQVSALSSGCFSDPFSFLGPHVVDFETHRAVVLRIFIPSAISVEVLHDGIETQMKRYLDSSLFVAQFEESFNTQDYRLKVSFESSEVIFDDIYRFASALDEHAMYLFNEGTLEHGNKHFGARFLTHQGAKGVQFSVWAPNAKSVSVIGDFNYWQPNQHFMRLHPASGVWDLFVPGLQPDQCYKFAITTLDGSVLEKADPFAQKMQQAPGTASILQENTSVVELSCEQINARRKRNSVDAPISIYEVHLGSWKRRQEEGNRYLTYRELADDLVSYVKELGFSHIQLMPISEYPFDGSWGYQPVGLFSPTSRFGSVEDFKYFSKKCEEQEVGLLLDWVPGHFPTDPHGLQKFDGTHLYEHADKRQGFHPDWNTCVFNYERPEIKSYLLSNANYWLSEFKLDGLRVDAVASMLYLDYSRNEGEWIANQYGGRENIGAINCLQSSNSACYKNNPHIMMVAEESTAWPGVTQSVEHGGLGFGFKWNMGWMNDSLGFMQRDPIHRKYHHHEMTFSMAYAFSENYILPLSHDEVVHGKGSLLSKMPGDDWQQFANLRAYYGFMFAHPGKKLLFMGSELAPRTEWDHNQSLDWSLLESEAHSGIYKTVKSLNKLYNETPALYEVDTSPAGFRWIDCNNDEQSIFSFARFGKHYSDLTIVVSHFTPQVFHHFKLGIPRAGVYQVVFNSDDQDLFGSGVKVVAHKQQLVESKPVSSHGFEQSIEITVPPLCTVYLKYISA
ncbi:1,4-alpha-glucan branching protein GlgB [Pseudoalteromonas luteoviolacea]|uniref:1,4-alpha-glucan branching protein GlgB n=1 Tax=Pseudoalteromonas luteoviolacea TaxID=43657 RepID=UPI00115314D2|nr:1,4-alpha-glucan branching protein GlgB [Pseudoalteromonas luteoviolacea]TQF67435.1 1,4-alpha-glucan branching protein GlgB [Pseudoalteromonas luteoviolacea]